MWFWYLLVAVASVIENIAGIPFTQNWTMRITKSPHNIQISHDAPVVQGSHDEDVLQAIHRGFNVTSMVTIPDQEPYVKRNSCFYVIVSAEGVSAVHACFRVISKGSSVAVFAYGTALFASASLVSVTVTVMVLGLVLVAGVFGRVTAMWIAAEMNKVSDPILHTVVQNRSEAAKHVQEILNLPDLIVEIGGHVIVNGRAIRRRNPWLSLSRYIGLLAPPFDVTKLAVRADKNLEEASQIAAKRSQSSSSSSPENPQIAEEVRFRDRSNDEIV